METSVLTEGEFVIGDKKSYAFLNSDLDLAILNYKKALNVLKKNVTNLNAENFTKIEEIDCFHYFSKQILTSKLYDIIFLDPPYKESKINLLIDKILEIQLLKDNGILIIHRHKNDKVKITSNLNILISRDYGISKIIMGN